VNEDIEQIIKIAEDFMYKRKLLEHKSSYSVIITSIKATMFERSQDTEEHAKRLIALTKEIGMKLNLSQIELDELELLATLHDIGKVGIDDKILNKPGKMTGDEWIEMKKHPEIGYRIAMSVPELVPIAEYILSHHEHWDGNGYPQGLKGQEIPLISRVLTIVDAYDAMIQDRIYRKAMTKEAAIAEIMKNAGTQFDPNIAKIFIENVVNMRKDS
jgi:HD-GYP domain-containing protein (c-di-GMP phosphodiesterase class II)